RGSVRRVPPGPCARRTRRRSGDPMPETAVGPHLHGFGNRVGGATVIHERVDDVVEVAGRCVTDETCGQRSVWVTPLHVLVPLSVGLLVVHVGDRALGTGQLHDAIGQTLDGDLFLTAQVDRLVVGLRRLHQAGHGRDHVIHRAEATALGARAVHGDGFARKGLVHEPGDDHAVAPRLARADHVEEPCDDARYAGLGPVYVGDQLVEPLGGRVRPSTLGRSTVDA